MGNQVWLTVPIKEGSASMCNDTNGFSYLSKNFIMLSYIMMNIQTFNTMERRPPTNVLDLKSLLKCSALYPYGEK